MLEKAKTVKDLVNELQKWLRVVENLQNDFNYTKAIQSKKLDKLEIAVKNVNNETETSNNADHNKCTVVLNQDLAKLSKEKEILATQIEELDDKLKVKENEIIELESRLNQKTEALQSRITNISEIYKNSKNETTVTEVVNKMTVIEDKLKTIEQNVVTNEVSRKFVKISTKHKSDSKCPHCDENFSTKTNMENHIDQMHDKQTFNCDKCKKTFVSEWRLKIHDKTHVSNKVTRNCHYYNSDKPYPFQRLRCKFNHMYSKSCKFGLKCTFKMCQFKHQ